MVITSSVSLPLPLPLRLPLQPPSLGTADGAALGATPFDAGMIIDELPVAILEMF